MKKKKIVFIVLGVLICIVTAGFIYVNDYYHASPEAFLAINEAVPGILVVEEKDESIVFIPEEVSAGFIFYPGGKVEYEAYAPLMKQLAEQGILCVLLHMPANLAVLDMKAAEGVQDMYPQVEDWYIGGHSLGGSMAASYVAQNVSEYEGLILLASYSTAELQESNLQVVSIYGSEDTVLNSDKYAEYRDNLPEKITEVVIDGGCHAYFGSYGAQEGDGVPTITAEEQLQITTDVILSALTE